LENEKSVTLSCTGCRRCCQFCPKALDIPELLNLAKLAYACKIDTETLEKRTQRRDLQPFSCVGCGLCARVCPQRIHAGKEIVKLAAFLKNNTDCKANGRR